jgi:hypothetical protein
MKVDKLILSFVISACLGGIISSSYMLMKSHNVFNMSYPKVERGQVWKYKINGDPFKDEDKEGTITVLAVDGEYVLYDWNGKLTTSSHMREFAYFDLVK